MHRSAVSTRRVPSPKAAPPAPSQPSFVSPALLTSLASAHAFFDANRAGFLSIADLGPTLRACGFVLTSADVDAIIRGSAPVYGSRITRDALVDIVATLVLPRYAPPSHDDVRHAFDGWVALRALGSSEPPRTWLHLAELHALLTEHGDALSTAEFLRLLRALHVSPGTATVGVAELLRGVGLGAAHHSPSSVKPARR